MSLQPDEDDMNHYHILAKPMFEVFGISIHTREIKDRTYPNSVCDGNPCKIHGMVQVVDEDDKKIDLYNRKENNHEIINFGDFLSLTGFPIIPYKALKVAINLYDMAHDAEIANGAFIVDYRTKYDYDKVHVAMVEGRYGFAYVYHATFQHAVMATVEQVILQKEVGGSRFGADLFGNVVARLERIYGNSNGDVHSSFILFDNQQNGKKSKSVQAKFNTPIKLFRSYVVLPVFCSLRIKADFCDNAGNIVVNDFKRDISTGHNDFDKTVSDQSCQMLVQVECDHCYEKVPKELKVKDNFDAKEESTQGIEVECDHCYEEYVRELKVRGNIDAKEESTQGIQVECDHCYEEFSRQSQISSEAQQPSSNISRLCAARPTTLSFVEVFSVLICLDDNDLDICGTIEMIDSSGSFFIFDGHERCCERKTLSILGPPRSFEEDPFGVHINLKDGKGRVVGKGFLEWTYRNNDGPISFYNRHICSVIKGDVGYVAVHYSMFRSSLQARIWVSFVSHRIPQASAINVYGRITAEYGNYEYSTPYDQEYYKSTLFSKSQDDCVLVNLGSTVPLLKSVVSVPLEGSLILDVNLNVIGPFVDHNKEKGNYIDPSDDKTTKSIQEFEVFQELVEFKPNVGSYFLIEKGNYVISMCVEWSSDKNPEPFIRPILPDKRSIERATQKILVKRLETSSWPS